MDHLGLGPRDYLGLLGRAVVDQEEANWAAGNGYCPPTSSPSRLPRDILATMSETLVLLKRASSSQISTSMLIIMDIHNHLQYLPTVCISCLATGLQVLTTPQFLDKVFPELIRNADCSTTAWQTTTAVCKRIRGMKPRTCGFYCKYTVCVYA